MEFADLLGWVAVLFTLTAFSMRTMLPLRAAAIGANLCFIGFGYLEGTLPILTLHAILLPCNMMRLKQIILAQRELNRLTESDIETETLSTRSLYLKRSARTDGKVAVEAVDQGFNKSGSVPSSHLSAEHSTQEIAALRAENAALREQLRQSVSDQTVGRRSANDERVTLGLQGDASFRRGAA